MVGWIQRIALLHDILLTSKDTVPHQFIIFVVHLLLIEILGPGTLNIRNIKYVFCSWQL